MNIKPHKNKAHMIHIPHKHTHAHTHAHAHTHTHLVVHDRGKREETTGTHGTQHREILNTVCHWRRVQNKVEGHPHPLS